MRTRTLRLTKETLTALDTGELRSVVGGDSLGCLVDSRNYTYCIECTNDISFEFCPTPTLPLENCV